MNQIHEVGLLNSGEQRLLDLHRHRRLLSCDALVASPFHQLFDDPSESLTVFFWWPRSDDQLDGIETQFAVQVSRAELIVRHESELAVMNHGVIARHGPVTITYSL
jgi:hypothetical protein